MLRLDLETEVDGVHPRNICPKCWKRLERFKAAVAEGRTFTPSVPSVPEFSRHDDTCGLCYPHLAAGRPKKIRKYNAQPIDSTTSASTKHSIKATVTQPWITQAAMTQPAQGTKAATSSGSTTDYTTEPLAHPQMTQGVMTLQRQPTQGGKSSGIKQY